METNCKTPQGKISNIFECRQRCRRRFSLRIIAFVSVVFSTVAVTVCLLTFPLIFHYVQTLQALVQVRIAILLEIKLLYIAILI